MVPAPSDDAGWGRIIRASRATASRFP
ncbi:MAG: hypothetical protein F4X40_07020 [Chloroflexi bacterium]|nr:hypothetical protein [Chloroflexota bacterium]